VLVLESVTSVERPALAGTLLVCLLLGAPGRLAAQGPSGPSLVITGATVIDVRTGAQRPGSTVVVRGNRIVGVMPDSEYRVPRGVARVDAGGRYLVPGLWDMHVHTAAITMIPGQEFEANAAYVFPLLLAHGVTGIRDMSGKLETLRRWRDSVARGLMLGPRMVITGRKVGGALPVVPGGPHPVRNAAEVRRSVRLLREQRADFVKVDGLPVALYPVLFEAARAEGLRVAGHVPPWIGLGELADDGLWTAEHLQGVFLDASTRRRELIRREQRARTWWGRLLIRLRLWDIRETQRRDRRTVVETWSDSAAVVLAARLRRNGTWETPTLIGLRDIAGEPPTTPRDDQLPYRLPFHDRKVLDESDVDIPNVKKRLDLYYRAAGVLARSGVPLLAGSDMPGTRRVPGFSLIEELEELEQAGLTPLQALEAATVNPARALGFADSLGTIESGKLADLVLLDRNPLEGARNLRTVRPVVVNGRLLGRAELDRMLSDVRRLALETRTLAARTAPANAAARSGGDVPPPPGTRDRSGRFAPPR